VRNQNDQEHDYSKHVLTCYCSPDVFIAHSVASAFEVQVFLSHVNLIMPKNTEEHRIIFGR
jgi:hypothetical protein